MGFRLTAQERRIAVFVGVSLIAGGIVKLVLHPAPEGDPALEYQAAQAQRSEPVNLNTAGAFDLQHLPGIGPTLASRIVARRQESGPFQSVDELADVKGVGPRTVARLRGLVTVEASDTLDTSAGAGLDR